jgi:hypothetical protein
LITTWTVASQHLMHFSSSRAVPLNYGQADLEQFADEVLSVWDQFATASNHQTYHTARTSQCFGKSESNRLTTPADDGPIGRPFRPRHRAIVGTVSLLM